MTFAAGLGCFTYEESGWGESNPRFLPTIWANPHFHR